jgi:hypothetical protein
MALVSSIGAGICSPASAQSTGSGVIQGVVRSVDGNPVANARVVLSAADSTPLTVTSGADGVFSWRDVRSGPYTIQVESVGFAPLEDGPISVAVGRTIHLTLTLALASSSQTVTVSATPVTFDTSQTSSVINIDRDRVEELPIPSRNYLSFVLLAPQVSAANPALSQSGVVPGGGSFSFGGLRPGSNSVYLDDVNDNDEYSGGSRTQLSPEAISDFQIVNHGFAAKSGGGAGGSIDVQTRAGVNRVHGDGFSFVQNGALNGTPPLGLFPNKPTESRVRAGVALGGPMLRDRTFFYTAAEQEIAHGQEANDLGPATLDALHSSLGAYGPLSKLVLESGFFPITDQETEVSGRVDHRFTPNESLFARYAFTNARNVNDAFHAEEQADRSARGSSFTADHSLNATLSSTISATMLNKLSVELAQRRAVERTGEISAPGVLIAGTVLLGTPFSGNDRRFETHVEFADSFSSELRHHLLEAGMRGDHVSLRAHIPDGSQGFFVFADLSAFQDDNPDFYTQSFGDFDTNSSAVRFAGFAQDHWLAAKSLTIDYGVRYDYNGLPGSVQKNALNFSPRLGFAWTPLKATLVQGGFGTFFDRFQLATIHRIEEFGGQGAAFQVLEDAAAATLFRSGQVPAAPIPGVAPSIWTTGPVLKNPYSEVASLSIEQSLPYQSTFTAEYQFVRGVHLGRTSNINLAPPVMLTQANALSLGVSSPTAQQIESLVFSPARQNPAYDAIHQFATSASSAYDGATFTINRQFQDDLQVLAGYTYSKTIDDASSDMEQPQNPYGLRSERAASLQDQRHRFTLSGLWLIGPDLGDPADAVKNANPGPLLKALTGLEFAPIVSVASGFRSNPVVGVDSNREHIFPFASRPAGYARNSLATPWNVNVDLRILKMVPVRGGHLDIVAESFNILNHRNVTELDPVFGTSAQKSPGFSIPIATSTARRVQFSLDYEF